MARAHAVRIQILASTVRRRPDSQSGRSARCDRSPCALNAADASAAAHSPEASQPRQPRSRNANTRAKSPDRRHVDLRLARRLGSFQATQELTSMKVAFIGIGTMGKPMATNI